MPGRPPSRRRIHSVPPRIWLRRAIRDPADGVRRPASPSGAPHAFDGSNRVICQLCGRTYRRVAPMHLWFVHGYDLEDRHPVETYKARFRLGYATARRSRRKVWQALRRHRARIGSAWGAARVLRMIRSGARGGADLSRTGAGNSLVLAASRRFGSWARAVAAAGVKYARFRRYRRWDPERVLAEIRALAGRGRRVSRRFVKREHPALFAAAEERFGSNWARTLQAAGLDPMAHREPRSCWTWDRAGEWVRRSAATGRSLWARDVPKPLLAWVLRRRPGGWADFVESHDIPYPGERGRRDWSREEVVIEIRRRHESGLGLSSESPGARAVAHQAARFFGSWTAAVAAAGFPVAPPRRRWTAAAVKSALRARQASGRSLVRKVVLGEDSSLARAAIKRWGPWRRALAAAGVAARGARGDG